VKGGESQVKAKGMKVGQYIIIGQQSKGKNLAICVTDNKGKSAYIIVNRDIEAKIVIGNEWKV